VGGFLSSVGEAAVGLGDGTISSGAWG
jgi:hypothetical protein